MYSSRQLARDVGKFDTVADTTDSAYVQAADFTHFGELAQVLRARLGGEIVKRIRGVVLAAATYRKGG